MTRVLIVDDDPNQVRLLARVISTREPGLSVITATGGEEAIELLRSMPVDLVLTDLQMPDTNGFQLVDWLLSHQPHVQTFTMTAYPDDEAVARLSSLGSVECYTKPLDVAGVLEKLSVSLAQGMRGHVRNIGLPSLLQLIEMERKTCTLTVESAGRTGYIYIDNGAMVDARWDETHGQDAAVQIAGWRSSNVTIVNTCPIQQATIQAPMGFIIMEAMRVADEAQIDEGQVTLTIPPGQEDSFQSLLPSQAAPGPSAPAPPMVSELSLEHEARAMAIIHAETGQVYSHAGSFEGLEALAEVVANVYANEAATVASLGIQEHIDELVMTTERFWTMTRPLDTSPPCLALLVFDPKRANLVMERLELDGFIAERQSTL